jgi:hypothetical protein
LQIKHFFSLFSPVICLDTLKKTFTYLIVGITTLFSIPVCFGNNPEGVSFVDSLYIRNGQTLIVNNKAFPFYSDTVIFLHKGIDYRIKNQRGDFFDRLQQKSMKYRWTRELHNIIISPASTQQDLDSLPTSSAIQPFMLYSGDLIRNIRIKRLNVFGPTVYDTSALPVTWVGRTGNQLHFRSKEYLIRKNLLFEKGGRIDPMVLAHNERLLRSLPYIEDARIVLKKVSPLNDSVDVLVITKDIWPNAFNIESLGANSGELELWNRNILGFGEGVQHTIPWKSAGGTTLGYQGVYKLNNIAGTFINSNLTYQNAFSNEYIGLQIERSFFTPNTKYAGGAAMSQASAMMPLPGTQQKYLLLILPISLNHGTQPMKYYTYDVWLGRSFYLNPHGFSNLQKNLTIASRLYQIKYLTRPDYWHYFENKYQNRKLWLSSVTYSRQTYMKSSYIYNYGRTEDIAIGGKIGITAGYEYGELQNRTYFGFQAGHSTFGNWGYLFGGFEASAYLTSENKFEQSFAKEQIYYFSPLIIARTLKFRQFISLSYTRGALRKNFESLNINNRYGLYGFKNDSLLGQSRALVHMETDCFAPWKPQNFRFTFYLSADFAWIGNSEYFFNKEPYSAVSLGVRIRNERLVFKTIQFRFSYYPNIPTGSVTNFFEISGETALNAPNFTPQAPSESEYY